MDTVWYDSVEDAFDAMAANPAYAIESALCDPADRSTYQVSGDNMLLVTGELDGRVRWVEASRFGNLVVGLEFNQLIDEFPAIIGIAFPVKYNFTKDRVHQLNVYFDWSAFGRGFGQMSFGRNVDGQLEMSTEMMGRESTRHMLHQFVDFLVDNSVNDDWSDK